MNTMRKRAKEQFPTVLLTLLSIVQALALELLWSHLDGADGLYQLSFVAVLWWLQILITLLGIVLIWVVYASSVMRFSWVPGTIDSVLPFVIGLLEFLLVELLGPEDLGVWFIVLAVIVCVMHWISHHAMRRARFDDDNAAFFAEVEPAAIRDFYPPIAMVLVLLAFGLYLTVSGSLGWIAMVALLTTLALLMVMFADAAGFWRRSLSA